MTHEEDPDELAPSLPPPKLGAEHLEAAAPPHSVVGRVCYGHGGRSVGTATATREAAAESRTRMKPPRGEEQARSAPG